MWSVEGKMDRSLITLDSNWLNECRKKKSTCKAWCRFIAQPYLTWTCYHNDDILLRYWLLQIKLNKLPLIHCFGTNFKLILTFMWKRNIGFFKGVLVFSLFRWLHVADWDGGLGGTALLGRVRTLQGQRRNRQIQVSALINLFEQYLGVLWIIIDLASRCSTWDESN